VKRLFLSDFYENRNKSQNSTKHPKYETVQKFIRCEFRFSMQTDQRTDRHDAANNRFLQLLRGMSLKIPLDILSTKMHRNPSVGSCSFPYGQTKERTDTTWLTVDFCNCFANTPKTKQAHHVETYQNIYTHTRLQIFCFHIKRQIK